MVKISVPGSKPGWGDSASVDQLAAELQANQAALQFKRRVIRAVVASAAAVVLGGAYCLSSGCRETDPVQPTFLGSKTLGSWFYSPSCVPSPTFCNHVISMVAQYLSTAIAATATLGAIGVCKAMGLNAPRLYVGD